MAEVRYDPLKALKVVEVLRSAEKADEGVRGDQEA